jgi:hypothetical protein
MLFILFRPENGIDVIVKHLQKASNILTNVEVLPDESAGSLTHVGGLLRMIQDGGDRCTQPVDSPGGGFLKRRSK